MSAAEPEENRPTLGLERRFRLPAPTPRLGAAVVLTATLAAGAAIGLRGALDLCTSVLFRGRHLVEAFRTLPPWQRAVFPALGAALGAVVTVGARRFPESRGLRDVMEAVVLGRGRVSLRATLSKVLASFLALLGGGSIGREGPILQLGAALGGTVAERLRLPAAEARLLLAAGTAAGFAAAYNTPIAAALFVTEIVTGAVSLEILVPVLVAAAIGTGLSRLALGEGPFYGARSYALVGPGELALSVLLGPLGGLVGAAFIGLLAAGERLFSRIGSPVARAAFGGLVVGSIAVAVPEVVGNGAEPIRDMLDGRVVVGAALAVLFLAKPLATTASVGSGSAGGVFTPSMFLGAALGGGLGSIVSGGTDAAHDSVVGACAVVGMASTVAATTHAPLLASVLAFEMSGDYALVIPLLCATALATATSRALGRDSVYVAELKRRAST